MRDGLSFYSMVYIWPACGYAKNPQEVAIKAMAGEIGEGQAWEITTIMNEETGQAYEIKFEVSESVKEPR